jgi:predicted MPP superfamily phosphohydrolase
MKITRRRFLAGIGAAGAVVGADAFGFEANRVVLTRHDVRIPGLPLALDNVRIAQITDVHLPGNQLAARAVVELIRQERPEVVVLSGDMTETVRASSQVRDFVVKVRGSIATVAVLGNWEYRAGAAGETARATYQGTGAELLVNQTKIVPVGAASLALVGLDDLLAGRPDLAQARRGLNGESLEIWLMHEPALADTLAAAKPPRPALLLAGHTHGGQIRIPFLPPVKPIGAGRFLEGWYRDTLAPLYVSRGVGTTGIQARFRCPAELPIFTLRRSS